LLINFSVPIDIYKYNSSVSPYELFNLTFDKNYMFKWFVISFDSLTFKIQLIFEDPLIIS